MKKISIILASLLAALLLASCTPVSSFDTTTEEGQQEYSAFLASLPYTVTVEEAEIGKVEIKGKGFEDLPATVTLTVADGKTVAVGKKATLTVDTGFGDVIIYQAEKATVKPFNAGETITLKKTDDAEGMTIIAASFYADDTTLSLE